MISPSQINPGSLTSTPRDINLSNPDREIKKMEILAIVGVCIVVCASEGFADEFDNFIGRDDY